MIRNRRLSLELLEDRLAPSTSGITWPDGGHLTLSFVPDGTPVGSYKSNLFQTLDAVGPSAAWQQAILRAFQSWPAVTNLNVGVVADGGQPLGTSGAVQGDTRFGDIRVAAAPLGGNTLITNSQFQWSGTTWSGDVVVNSSYKFNLDGSGRRVRPLHLHAQRGRQRPRRARQPHRYHLRRLLPVRRREDRHRPPATPPTSALCTVTGHPTRTGRPAATPPWASATNLGIALNGVSLQADLSAAERPKSGYKFPVPTLLCLAAGHRTERPS